MAGFDIGGEHYPFPVGFRLGDTVLVAEITGLDWDDFAELLDKNDPRSLAGMVAVAVWQKHPEWRRDKVVKFVEAIDTASIVADAGDAGPPLAEGDTTKRSPAPSTGSPDENEHSATQILASSGALS